MTETNSGISFETAPKTALKTQPRHINTDEARPHARASGWTGPVERSETEHPAKASAMPSDNPI